MVSKSQQAQHTREGVKGVARFSVWQLSLHSAFQLSLASAGQGIASVECFRTKQSPKPLSCRSSLHNSGSELEEPHNSDSILVDQEWVKHSSHSVTSVCADHARFRNLSVALLCATAAVSSYHTERRCSSNKTLQNSARTKKYQTRSYSCRHAIR